MSNNSKDFADVHHQFADSMDGTGGGVFGNSGLNFHITVDDSSFDHEGQNLLFSCPFCGNRMAFQASWPEVITLSQGLGPSDPYTGQRWQFFPPTGKFTFLVACPACGKVAGQHPGSQPIIQLSPSDCQQYLQRATAANVLSAQFISQQIAGLRATAAQMHGAPRR